MDPFQDFMSRVAEADEFGGIDCSDDGFEGFQIDFNSIVPTTVTNYKGNWRERDYCFSVSAVESLLKYADTNTKKRNMFM